MKIGIITALPAETQAVLKNAPKVEKVGQHGLPAYKYNLYGHDLVVMEGGMAGINAARAAELLVMAERPGCLISAGLGGGVRPGLVVGDVVLSQQVLLYGHERFEKIQVISLPGLANTKIKYGGFITNAGILNKKKLSQRLPADFENPVVDMESAAIARVANAHDIPFIGIRAISDPWNEELKFDINDFCDAGMRISPIKVFFHVMRHPDIIPQLLRLAGYSNKATAQLGDAVKQLLQYI